MSDKRLKQIRERLEAATLGPWVVCPDDPDFIESADRERVSVCKVDHDPHGRPLADAIFIANAPADIAYLLAEVDRLEREVEAWERARWEGAP